MPPSSHKLLPFSLFMKKVCLNLFIAAVIILFSLGVGIWGYAYFGSLDMPAAYENAAMILSGMGPVAEMPTTGGKIFAGTYALFSGIIFLVAVAVIIAPLFHRFLHSVLVKDTK